MLITQNVPPLTAVWANDSSPRSNYTTGSWYGGVTEASGTDGEASGSLVSVQTGSTAQRGLVSAQHSSDGSSARLVGKKSRGTRAVPTAVQSGDSITKLVSFGFDGSTYIPSAEISFDVDQPVAAGSVPQSIVFKTGTNATPTTRFSLFSGSATYQAQFVSSVELSGVLAVRATGLATNVADAGDIRLRSTVAVNYRNVANNANISLISTASNNLFLGDETRTPEIQLRANTTALVDIAGTAQLTVNTTRVEHHPSEISWDRGVASPILTQQPKITDGNAQNLWVRAQTVNATTGNGGTLLLSGGKPSGASLRGGVQMCLNINDIAASQETMVEAAEVASGRRVVSLARAAAITTTQMPANTGDQVIYVADAGTNPSAGAVSGHIYYSDGARPAWRFSGINLRLNGTSTTASAGGGAAVPANVDRFLSIDIGGTTLKIPAFAA